MGRKETCRQSSQKSLDKTLCDEKVQKVFTSVGAEAAPHKIEQDIIKRKSTELQNRTRVNIYKKSSYISHRSHSCTQPKQC